jgi:multidrug efflux pump subunit AcrA (membrane-fusion protein)
VQEVVFASGIMEMENEYVISTKVDGILTQLASKEGDCVQANQTIAMLASEVQKSQLNEALVVFNDSKKNALPSSPQLQHLESQIKQGKEQLFFDREQYLKKKLQFEASSNNLLALEENYKELENSLQLNVLRNQAQVHTQQALLQEYSLQTQAAGLVINVYKKQGELVRRGEEILKIGSGKYISKLFISEEDITQIQINQKVIVSINTYLDRTFTAKVSKIYPSFDESEQSYIVEAEFTEFPEKLFSGTQLQANIQTNAKSNMLLIPTAYLKNNKVQLENGELKTLELGFSNSEWTEVKSGISENDIIIKQ